MQKRQKEPTKDQLTEFLKTFSIILFVLSAWQQFRTHLSLSRGLFWVAIIMAGTAFLAPDHARGFYKVWIKMTVWIGTKVTRIILWLIYYLFITPYAILTKLIKGHWLEVGFRDGKSSYWQILPVQRGGRQRYLKEF
jgi:hypothetical protein